MRTIRGVTLVVVLLALRLNLSSQVMTTVAGGTWIFRGDGVSAVSAPLGRVTGIAVDSAGNLYAADSSNDVIIKVSAGGNLSVVAGNGFRGFSGEGGPGPSASLFSPMAVAIDLAGNIYIADTLNNRIRKVNGRTITTIAGTGEAGYAGDNGLAITAKFNAPSGLAVDSAGNVYVADTLNHRVRKVGTNGIVATVAGTGTRGDSGDNGPATNAALNYPRGLAFDAAGNLLIADYGNHRVRQVTPAGTITTAAGNGTQGSAAEGAPAAQSSLSFPWAVAVDATDNLYIADSVNQRIRRVSNGLITTVAGNGTRAFSGDSRSALAASLAEPRGVAADRNGNVFIADTSNNRVRRVASGTITTVAGNGMYKYGGDGALAVSAFLNGPQGMATDDLGNFYVADTLNHRIRKVNAAGIASTYAGNGIPGFGGDEEPVSQASMSSPAAVAMDAAGNLYVADTGNHRVRKVTVTGTITTVAGTGTASFSGDNGPAVVAALNQPSGVAADVTGNVYIADTGNHRIRKIDSTGSITTVAGNGVAASSGDNGPAAAASLNSPAALALDAARNLYVTETAGNRIRKISSGGTITTVAGTGVASSTGDGGPAVAANLNTPGGVAVDANGNLFVSETFGNRIRKIAGGTISTAAGTGLPGFSGDGGSPASASLNQPMGVAVGATGDLYVADTLNDRVRAVVASSPTLVVSPGVLGYTLPSGAPASSSQLLSVSSSASGVPWAATAATDDGQSWLIVSPSSGSAPGAIAVSVNPSNLPAGNYTGRISVLSSVTSPFIQTIAVNLTVQAPTSPQLALNPAELTIEAPTGSATLSRTVQVRNTGGGTLNWTAQSDSSWLTLSASSGSSSFSTPAPVELRAKIDGLLPGVYSSAVQVTSAGSSQPQKVIVTLLIAQPSQTTLLSQAGFSFIGVEAGGIIPPDTFGVLNTGQGVMNWAAEPSTYSGGSWLGITPASGSSDASLADIPFVSVTATPGSLAAGRYSGLVKVRAPTAANSPQVVSVDMNLLPRGANPGVQVRPTGLIFVAREGGSSPGSQTVTLATASPAPAGVTASAFSFDNLGWLAALPLNATVGPGDQKTITVQPTLGSLAKGEYRGTVALLFTDGTPTQLVNVLFLVTSGSGTSTLSRGARDVEPLDTACTPQKVLAVHRTLGDGFAAHTGLARAVEVRVTDDCGNSIANATALVSFSSGDPLLTLTSLKNGTYVSTWRPTRSDTQVTVSAHVELPPLKPADVQVRGTVSASVSSAAVFPGGVVNAASYAQGSAAPGSIVSVFGQNMASGSAGATQVPLPKSLAGATMQVGGIDVPLFYSSTGQINAQLPFELQPGTRPQLVVRTGESMTLPETITIAPGRPGIFSRNMDGQGQGMITDAITYVMFDANNPAKAGDYAAIYCTGLGQTDLAVPSGEPAPLDKVANTIVPVQVTIGGQLANVLFAGLAPGWVGLYQVNVQVPSGTTPGAAVPLVILQNGISSNTVTLAVR